MQRSVKESVLKDHMQVFWQAALEEFNRNMEMYKPILDSLDIEVPDRAVDVLKRAAEIQIKQTDSKIKNYIENQTVFKSNQSREKLKQSSHRVIEKHRTNWERGNKVPKVKEDLRDKIIHFFKELEKLKHQAEEQSILSETFKGGSPHLSAYELLKVLFHMVLCGMYPEKWGDLIPMIRIDHEDPNGDRSYEETVS
jgi:hypothetical protein